MNAKGISIILVLMIAMSLAVLLQGCTVFQHKPTVEVIPQTQKELLYKSVMKTNWLVTAAILGIGLSAFSFMNGGKYAMASAAACFIVLTMSLAVARYATVMAIGGTVVSFGLSIYTIFVKNRAIKEIVGNIQHLKRETPLTYVGEVKEFLNNQSNTTKEIVASVKKKIGGE